VDHAGLSLLWQQLRVTIKSRLENSFPYLSNNLSTVIMIILDAVEETLNGHLVMLKDMEWH